MPLQAVTTTREDCAKRGPAASWDEATGKCILNTDASLEDLCSYVSKSLSVLGPDYGCPWTEDLAITKVQPGENIPQLDWVDDRNLFESQCVVAGGNVGGTGGAGRTCNFYDVWLSRQPSDYLPAGGGGTTGTSYLKPALVIAGLALGAYLLWK